MSSDKGVKNGQPVQTETHRQRDTICLMRSCFRCAEPAPFVVAIDRSEAYTPASVSGLGFISIVCAEQGTLP